MDDDKIECGHNFHGWIVNCVDCEEEMDVQDYIKLLKNQISDLQDLIIEKDLKIKTITEQMK